MSTDCSPAGDVITMRIQPLVQPSPEYTIKWPLIKLVEKGSIKLMLHDRTGQDRTGHAKVMS